MGLRINADVRTVNTLRHLQRSDAGLQRALERVATARRINRAGDDPSGLVVAGALRAQLAGLTQAVDNTARARNVVRTADAGLEGISEALVGLRGTVTAALNDGGLDGSQRRALQDEVDRTIGQIDRIAGTTRFAGQGLLDGTAGFRIENASGALTQISVGGAAFGPGAPPLAVTVNLTRNAAQAITAPFADQAAAGVIGVTGALGTETLAFDAGTTAAGLRDAVNALSGNTGVEATGLDEFRSRDLGSDAFVEVQLLQGAFSGPTGRFQGLDAAGTVHGEPAAGRANVLTVSGVDLQAELRLDPAAPAGVYTFEIAGGGLAFQLGGDGGTLARPVLGVQGAGPVLLGDPDTGFISSLTTGRANDLFTNPSQALQIIDAAAARVNGIRGGLGAFDRQVVGPNQDALEVQFENLSATRSWIADANMAEETAAVTRNSVLRQANIAVLRQTNLARQGVLQLLSTPGE